MIDLKRLRLFNKYSQQVQNRIAKFAARNSIDYYKIGASKNGIMDCLLIYRSSAMFVEVKHPDDSESVLQEKTRERFNRIKEIAFVVYSYEDFLESFERFLRNAEIFTKKIDKRSGVIYDWIDH